VIAKLKWIRFLNDLPYLFAPSKGNGKSEFFFIDCTWNSVIVFGYSTLEKGTAAVIEETFHRSQPKA
jgi:hypothetical protein